MTTTHSHCARSSVRAALNDAVLALGGVVAVRGADDQLVEAIARALGAVARRHIRPDAGRSTRMDPAPRLRPHPAIAELLAQIGKASEQPESPAMPTFGDDEWLRLPGLFRRWEIEQVIDGDHRFHIEGAGNCEDGTSLFAVYARADEAREDER